MNFADQLKRIRRQLRDLDGNIWTRDFLKTAYNDVQRDLQRRTRVLEQVAVVKYPPRAHMSYMFDWEWTYLDDNETQFYQCLRNNWDTVYCYRWELQTEFGSSGITESGYQFTHKWEAFMVEPSMPVSIRFPSDFHTMKFLAWDKTPITYKPKKELMVGDSSFDTFTGEPVYYYREDDVDNSFIPYPLPSTVSWEDDKATEPIYVYAFSWESDLVTGEKFTRNDSTNSREYIFAFEGGVNISEDFYKGMWSFEIGGGGGEVVIYRDGDTLNTESGSMIRRDGSIFSSESGAVFDILTLDSEFFMVYDSEPNEIQDDTDVSDFPVFLRKYIEYGVLERAYGALTDGKISSLKEYWGQRYQMGVEAIKIYLHKKNTDRDYRFLTQSIPARRSIRHPRLPSAYPPI